MLNKTSLNDAPLVPKTYNKSNATKTQTIITTSIFVLIMFLVLYPLLQLFITSFSSGGIGDPFSFTLKNYKYLAENVYLYGNSIFITIMSTLLSTIFGVGLAFILGRTDLPGRKILSSMVTLPFFITPLFGGLAWSLLGSPSSGFLNAILKNIFHLTNAPINIYGPGGIIWVFAIYFTPFTFLFTSGALKAMDPSLEESAAVLGAGKIKTTLRVTLPLITPAIFGGALMTMVMCIEQFAVPAILGTPVKYTVVPTAIYKAVSNFPPSYGTASTMGISLLIFTLIGTYFHNKLTSGNYQTVTGKNFRPKIVKLKASSKWILGLICVFYIFMAVILPIGTLLWASFLKYITPNFGMMRYSLDNYRYVLFQFPGTIKAIFNSVFLAFLGATAVLFLTGIAAWIVHRTKIKWRKALEYLTMIPIAVPAMVFSVGLLWTWIKVPGIYGTIWVLLICYITIYLPQGYRSISASIMQVDKVLEESASVVGASWMQRLKSILLPLIAPGAIAAWTLVFILVMRNLGASVLLSSSINPVLPVAIFNLWDQGDYTHLTALAMVQMAIVLTLLGITNLITSRMQKGVGGDSK